ncbi:MAG TPA: phosphatidylinositol-specific phospholipase C1-like protein [Polyangiaceae bacterium]|nr:phosphatidylinositol-specific phospholipase C1-like protein [Polyangiaceae bacterium]
MPASRRPPALAPSPRDVARGSRGLGAALLALAAAAAGCNDVDAAGVPTPVDPRAQCVERAQGASGPRWAADCLRMNHLQTIGTHNSYHVQARPSILSTLSVFSPDLATSISYSHPPLDEQLRGGVRQLELDVFADPAGGLYANRQGLPLVGEPAASGIAELSQPGFKVLHVQDIDFESTCWSLASCLATVRAWSEANPRHVPVLVLIEAKYQSIDDLGFDFSDPLPIGAPELEALEQEVFTALGDRLITPDFVRGERGTLEEAVRADGWPTVEAARGKIMLALDNEDAVRDAYLAGHPSLAGRAMFTSARPGSPEAAFVKLNDVLADGALVAQLAADGFLVRTRADVDTLEARRGDVTRRDAALASGAQCVSTDYPVPDPALGTGYAVALPEGPPARCNPVSAPPWCEPGLFAEQ